MRLLVDGVAFQWAGSESARLWRSILPALATQSELETMVLDRGGLFPLPAGITRIPFPTRKDRYTADDSELIQHVCDHYAIDVFTSTRDTTPLATPMFLVVDGSTSEVAGTDRVRQEEAIAIAYARRHVCVSTRMRNDLLRVYPTLDRVDVAPVGIDHAAFLPVDRDRVGAFRRRIGLGKRPYLVAHDTTSLFETLARFGIDAFDVLCIGGEPATATPRSMMLPPVIRVERIEALGEDLPVALSGATALVHPSRHDGFGLSVLEAMACGCPVVTTAHGALSEVLGDACLIFDSSQSGLAGALAQLRSEAVRTDLRDAGLRHAGSFDWSALVAAIVTAARETAALRDDTDYRIFAEAWQSLRRMQAAVDADTWAPPA